MWIIILLGSACSFFLLDHDILLLRSKFIFIPFFVLFLFWLYVVLSAFFVNREITNNAQTISNVVTHGVYSRVRHPIYAANILLGLSIAIMCPSVWVIVSVIWAALIFIAFAHLEEEVLEERFGKKYLTYKLKTPAFIPNFCEETISEPEEIQEKKKAKPRTPRVKKVSTPRKPRAKKVL